MNKIFSLLLQLWLRIPKINLLKGVGIILGAAALSFLVHLPLEPLSYILLQSFMGRFPYRIEFTSLDSTWLVGIRIEDLNLRGPTPLTLDTLVIRPALFVEGFRPGIKFRALREDGSLEGVLGTGDTNRIRFTVRKFPLRESGLGVLPNGFEIKGKLSGKGDILRTPGYPPNLSGDLTLEIQGGEVRLSQLYPLGITQLTCPEVRGDFTFLSNLLKIEPVELTCDKLHAVIRGQVLLRQTIPLSQLELHFFLQPQGEFLGILQTIAPLLRLARDPSGLYRGDFQGPLLHLIGRR